MSDDIPKLIPVRSPVIDVLAMGIGLYGLTTSNPVETIWTGILLWWVCRTFWWQQVPGIILFALIIPFIEIHTGVLNANSSNISLDEAFNGAGRKTFWLSSIGFLMVCLGLQATLKKERFAATLHVDRLRQLLQGVTMTRLILVYLILTLSGFLVDAAIPWNSSIKQLEVQFLKLPSVVLFATCIHYFLFRKQGPVFVSFIIIVTIQSLYSYFSEWRLPIEILITASLIQIKEFKMPQLLKYAPLFLPVLLFVGIWQSIKSEYRYILSDGKEDQTIQLSRSEAIETALNLAVASYEEGSYADSTVVQATYQRTGYLEYFAATLEKVPTEIPHEKGRLTSSNLEYTLIPRILNPNKALKNDRTKVEKYTGIYFGGEGSKASFSLGHYCEAYIDWGPFGMMLHLFIYGCLGGWFTNLLLNQPIIQKTIFGAGIIFTILSFWGTYQKDMITLTGSLLWGGLAFTALFPSVLRTLKRIIISRTT